MATIEFQVAEGSPAAARVAEALGAMGCEVTIQDGMLTAQAMTGPCVVCAGVFALDRLLPRDALGGAACPICAQQSDKVVAAFKAGALRASRELKAQLPRIIRDLRAGNDMPSFYQGFE